MTNECEWIVNLTFRKRMWLYLWGYFAYCMIFRVTLNDEVIQNILNRNLTTTALRRADLTIEELKGMIQTATGEVK